MPTVTTADGVRIHYAVGGRRDGEPVLCIQGLGTDSRGWLWQRAALGRRYRVITFDNRGAGRSDAPPGPYDLDVMADDAAAVLDATGYGSAHVLGASMGGVIAQKLALRHPHRVRSLVLACTACHTDPWRQEILERWAVEAETLGPRRFLLANLDWLAAGACSRWFWSLYARLVPQPFASSAQGFVGQVHACLGAADYRPALATISAPTLVVAGKRDRLTPVDDSVLLAGLIPGAELAVIPGAGHLFPIERAATFNRTVLRFLDAQGGPRKDLPPARSLGAEGGI